MKGNLVVIISLVNWLPPRTIIRSETPLLGVELISLHFAAESTVLLKAESVADKVEWLKKLGNIAHPSKAGQIVGDSGLPMRHSLSDGYLVSC